MVQDNKTISYTAANAMPVKIFKNTELVEEINRGYIPPFHVQLIPTNRCNLNCSFCSCRNRSKTDELSYSQIQDIMSRFNEFGCEAVTITGGGEPLMHKDIEKILLFIYRRDIDIGLVSNGLLMNRLSENALGCLTWCRVSACDERPFDEMTRGILDAAIKRGHVVDWAFSYVAGKSFNPKNLNAYIQFANDHDFTHVRVVSDLCDLDNVDTMEHIKSMVTVDDSLVVYQGRKSFDLGQKDCWISLLKPVVGADGKIYPCCGVQYAHQEQDYDLPGSMCMGTVDDIPALYDGLKKFDGRQCDRCYYKNYNDLLGMMMDKTEHVRFV